MSNILVTGGSGYIGSVLVPALLNSGHRIEVIDNLMYGQSSLASCVSHRSFSFVKGDVRNKEVMKPLIDKADVIIPLAAIVGAPACDRDPVAASSINREAVLEMFKLVSPNQQILMPTTNSAYGQGGDNNFCDETSKLNPLSLYARDKVLVENELMQLSGATSFRLATVFGISPRMRIDLLVNNFVYKALYDGYLTVFEGHFKRNFVHLVDVVQAFNLALNSPEQFKGEIFNVGLSSANISKLQLCEEIAKVIPNFYYIEADVGEDPDKRNYVVSNHKIESRGFKPNIDLNAGINELVRGLPLFQHPHYSNY